MKAPRFGLLDTEPDPLPKMSQWVAERKAGMEAEQKIGTEKGKHSAHHHPPRKYCRGSQSLPHVDAHKVALEVAAVHTAFVKDRGCNEQP